MLYSFKVEDILVFVGNANCTAKYSLDGDLFITFTPPQIPPDLMVPEEWTNTVNPVDHFINCTKGPSFSSPRLRWPVRNSTHISPLPSASTPDSGNTWSTASTGPPLLKPSATQRMVRVLAANLRFEIGYLNYTESPTSPAISASKKCCSRALFLFICVLLQKLLAIY